MSQPSRREPEPGGTRRQARVASVVAIDGHDETSLFALAASAAGGLDRILDGTCAGVVAAVDGRSVVLGTRAIFLALGLSVTVFGDWPERLSRRGERVLFVAVDGRSAGFVSIVDASDEDTGIS
jgi:hypothetical protein